MASHNVSVDWSSEDDENFETQHFSREIDVAEWCQCGQCEVWADQKEEKKKCCHLYSEVEAKLRMDKNASLPMKVYLSTVCPACEYSLEGAMMLRLEGGDTFWTYQHVT